MKQRFVAFLCGLLFLPVFLAGHAAYAQQTEIDKLKGEIDNRNDRLSEIDKEIAKFELQLMEVGAEKKTLQNEIYRLETERKKVNAEISKTENLISSTDLEISKLILEISRTEDDISRTETAIGEIIRSQYRQSDESLLELMLKHEKLSEVWSTIEAHDNVRDVMAAKVAELHTFNSLLSEKKGNNEDRRSDLSALKDQYGEQNQVLVNNKAEQNELLVATKNEEANYQALLNEKKTVRQQIESEMRDFEAKLQFILNPDTVPSQGTAVFAWPLANPIITQYFGGTEFAKQNASAYGRPYHSGMDLGAPRGTPILAPLSGTVRDTGNTDLVPGCYSWGKWTLIDHANGLSTLYAHQDVIGVTPGQKVSTGDVIGYVGNTGFSTGPHLHFTVYAKDGVKVRQFNEIKTVTSCGPAKTPVAATDAYFDPLVYLP